MSSWGHTGINTGAKPTTLRQRLQIAQSTSNTATRKRRQGPAYVGTLGMETKIGFDGSSSLACVWPLDDGECCGAPVRDRRKSYCDEHIAVAYIKRTVPGRGT